jgi:hypothetical protein
MRLGGSGVPTCFRHWFSLTAVFMHIGVYQHAGLAFNSRCHQKGENEKL